MILWLSGPTGSGKTTLAGQLANTGFAIVRETLPPPLFEAFRSDPARHCAALQEAIMRGRSEGWSRIPARRNVAFDRSVDEDLAIFCRLHAEHGLIDESAASHLQAVGLALQAALPPADLIVYLRPNAQVLSGRIARVGHPAPISETLTRQVDLYDEWATRQTTSLLRIDNGSCSIATMAQLLEGIRC